MVQHLSLRRRFLKNYILLFVCGLAVLTTTSTNALTVREEPVPDSDIKALPPLCRLILVEQPQIHLKAGDGPLKEDAAIFDQPQYALAKNNPHIHHYCWSLIHRMRYFRAASANERKYRFDHFMGDIDYVLRKSNKDYQYFHILLTEQADMLFIRGDYSHSILKIDEALRHQPDYDKAYVIKYDAYLGLGDKKKAIAAAQQGLEKNPRSKPLRRRLEQQGIKLSPLPPAPVLEPEAKEDTNTVVNSNAQTTQDSYKVPAPDAQQKEPEKPTPNPGNPYCRFCP